MNPAKLEEKVGEFKNYLRICKGGVAYPPGFVLLTNRSLPVRYLVAIIALGKACAHALNLSNDTLTPKECYENLRKQLPRLKPNLVQYHLSKLAKDGYLIRRKRGKYAFNVNKLDAFLEELKLYEEVH